MFESSKENNTSTCYMTSSLTEKSPFTQSSSTLKSVLKKRSLIEVENHINVPSKVLRMDVPKSINTPLQDIESVNRMQRIADRKKKNASQLWISGHLGEAIAEMCRAEALGVQISTHRKLVALCNANSDAFRSINRPSTGRRVQFNESPQVIGYADANIDRIPITVTQPTKIERLLIRAARILPIEG